MRQTFRTAMIAGLTAVMLTLGACPAVPATTAAAVSSRTCLGRQVTILGTPGNDVITGTSGPDVILTFTGRDRVMALGGDDRVCVRGWTGHDRGTDRVRAGGGNDRVVAQPRREGTCATGMFRGGPGDDTFGLPCGTVWGGTGDDRLTGGTVHPGSGQDIVENADVLDYGDARHGVRLDLLRNVAAADGIDSILMDPNEVYGSPFKDIMRGGEEGDLLDGGPGSDLYYGRGGTDEIFEIDDQRGVDVAFGGGRHARCRGIEVRHNCPLWDD